MMRFVLKQMVLLWGLLLFVAPCLAQSSETVGTADVKQYGDWFYRCVDITLPQKSADTSGKKTVKQCEVAQIEQVKRGEETVTVLSIAIALSAPHKAGQAPGLLMTSVTPLNVYLPAGLRYSVSGKDVIKSDYRNCNQSGCWVQQKLDQKALAAFKKAHEAEGHFRLLNGQNINIKFSLKGLSDALGALEKGAPRP